ncbi:alpha/beta fold hydrolase [Spirochaeta dissipatitropha]
MIHTHIIGQGRPVVFLHGLFGSGENLLGLARRLPAGFKAILADLPGHGKSSESADLSYETISDILVDGLSLTEPAIFVGHSMGGKAAMMTALRHPEQVASLAVLDIAPVTYPEKHLGILYAMREISRLKPGSRKEADRYLGSSISDSIVRGFLLKNYDSTQTIWRIPVESIIDQYEEIRGWDLPWDADPFPGPACCIYGSESTYVQPDQHEKLFQSLFPEIELVCIEEAEHWLHSSHLDQTSKALNRFLETSS